MSYLTTSAIPLLSGRLGMPLYLSTGSRVNNPTPFIVPPFNPQASAELLAAQYSSAIQQPNYAAPTRPVLLPVRTNGLQPSVFPVFGYTALPSRGASPVGASKLRVANELAHALQKIQTNPYGSTILNQILSNPRLNSLTIQTHPQPSALRQQSGITPTASTSVSFNSLGGVDATITMDASMLVKIMTKDGGSLVVDADNVLFHELAHVQLELNNEAIRTTKDTWSRSAELIATEYESNYGGYERDYYRSGTYTFWG